MIKRRTASTAAASHQEVALAMVSQQSSRAAAIPVPDALPEAARAFPVRRYPGELPPAGGGPALAEKAWRYWLSRRSSKSAIGVGEVRRSCLETYVLPTPRIVHNHLTGYAGQHSDAPEWCRDSGYRGTVCVHCARTGLWGGRLGNRWLYPEADGQQRPLVPRSRFPARLTPGVRLHEHGCTGMI